MKTALWVVVYFAIYFLVFAGWLVYFAQHAPFNGHEQAVTLKYLLNLFFGYVLMKPFWLFFQVDTYVNALMALSDDSEQMIRFYKEIPVMWIYSMSAALTFVVYIISAKWFTHNRPKRTYLTK